MQKLKKVYFLHYVYEFEDGHEDVKLLGVFSSKEKAKKALLDIKKNHELKKSNKCFCIDKVTMNRLGWEEGFVTMA